METKNYIISDVNLAANETAFGWAVSISNDGHGVSDCRLMRGQVQNNGKEIYLQPESQAAIVRGEYIKFKGSIFNANAGKVLERGLKAYYGL